MAPAAGAAPQTAAAEARNTPWLSNQQVRTCARIAVIAGIALLAIGAVGVVIGTLLASPLATSTIVAITLTEVSKNFALAAGGKIMMLAFTSLFVGAVTLKVGRQEIERLDDIEYWRDR